MFKLGTATTVVSAYSRGSLFRRLNNFSYYEVSLHTEKPVKLYIGHRTSFGQNVSRNLLLRKLSDAVWVLLQMIKTLSSDSTVSLDGPEKKISSKTDSVPLNHLAAGSVDLCRADCQSGGTFRRQHITLQAISLHHLGEPVDLVVVIRLWWEMDLPAPSGFRGMAQA